MDKYTVAKIGIHGAKATVLESNDITMGLTGAVVQLIYDDDLWQGMRKKVTFRGTKKVDVLTDENVVELPWEVTTAKNVTVSIGITGVDADEKAIIPTVWATIGTVKDSPYGAYPAPGEPVPPEWVQVLTMIGDLAKLDTDARDTLVAAINEVLSKVGSGGGSVDLDGYATEDWVNDLIRQLMESGMLDGEDGYSPEARVEQTAGGAVIVITDKDGTTTATVRDGKDGKDGENGVYTLAEGETLSDVPEDAMVVIDPNGEPDDPPAEGGDISLNVSGASVGQIVKVAAVDAAGKPTAWAAANLPDAYTKPEIDAIMGSYISAIDALVGGDI